MTGWTEIEASSNACFSSTDATLPLDYKFSPPYNGIIQGVRLFHTSGGTKCGSTTESNWGGTACGIRTKLLQLIPDATTSAQSSIIYPTLDTYDVSSISTYQVSGCGCDANQATMSEYTDTSSELIWYSDTQMYNVTTDDQFILGICEGVCQVSTSDNSGTSCARVSFLYQTVDTGMQTQYIFPTLCTLHSAFCAVTQVELSV